MKTRLSMAGLLSVVLLFPLQAQERFRPESWQFDLRASVLSLNSGNAAQRYSTALGVFMRAVGHNDRDIESAIDTMEAVYDEARARVRTDVGRQELAIFESMLGWFYMGLAETTRDLQDKENAARRGLSYLDRLLRENSDNLDVLFIYVRSTWFVPTTYRDLTENIQYAGERFLWYNERNPGNDDLDQMQRNVVLIALANVALEQNDLDSARNYYRQVHSHTLRTLSDYGCGRLEVVYREVEQALRSDGSLRVRTTW